MTALGWLTTASVLKILHTKSVDGIISFAIVLGCFIAFRRVRRDMATRDPNRWLVLFTTGRMRHVHRCMVATCGENGLLQYWLLRRERSPKQSDTGRSGMFVSSSTPPPHQHTQFERHADFPSHRPIYFDHFQKNVRYCLPRHQKRK